MKQTAKHCSVEVTRAYCLELGLSGLTAYTQEAIAVLRCPKQDQSRCITQ